MKKDINIKFEYFENITDLSESEVALFRQAEKARNNAYAPYSNFWVGCAIELENGEIVTGNNQENAAYPSGLCAERVAIFHLSSIKPNENIKRIFVLGGPNTNQLHKAIPPCGACRQSMLEYESKQKQNIQLLFAGLNGEVYKCQSLKDLLPFSFDVNLLINENERTS